MPSFVSLFVVGCLLVSPQSPASPPAPAGGAAGSPPAATAAASAPDAQATNTRSSSVSIRSSDITASQSEPGPVKIGPVTLSAYVQFDYVQPFGESDVAQNGTFRIRRARVYASGDITPKIAWWFSVDAAAPSILLDVNVTFKHLRAANIRVGQFVAPYSLERIISERVQELVERSLERFVPGRDIGVTVFNPEPFRGGLSYAIAVINGTGANTRDNNNAKDYVGRVVWRVPPLKALSLGANVDDGVQPIGRRTRWGVDANLDTRLYRIAAEYLRQTEPDWHGHTSRGWYFLVDRRFKPATPRPDFYMAEVVVRLSSIRDAAELPALKTIYDRREVDAGANYYFTRHVRVMADFFVPVDRQPGAPGRSFIGRVQFGF